MHFVSISVSLPKAPLSSGDIVDTAFVPKRTVLPSWRFLVYPDKFKSDGVLIPS